MNTDASFSRIHRVGTYAFWLTCNLGRYKESGPLKGEINDPTEAELKCIVNAFSFLINCKDTFRQTEKIFVNTDSTNAIYILTSDHQKIQKYGLNRKSYKAAKKMYHDKIKSHLKGKQVYFRHVKAHTDTQDSRSYVNAWCDTAAKQEMEKLINEILNNQKIKSDEKNHTTAA